MIGAAQYFHKIFHLQVVISNFYWERHELFREARIGQQRSMQGQDQEDGVQEEHTLQRQLVFL